MGRACRKKKYDQRGQTLIELLTALFVLSLTLIGGFSLVTSNYKNEIIGSSRLVASNLAREGVELARSIRDSNWLAGIAWDTGLKDPSGNNMCGVIGQGMRNFIFLSCKKDRDGNDIFFDPTYRVSKTDVGTYYQHGDNQADASATQFYRVISFAPICVVGQEERTDGCGANPSIGIQVISQVWWQQGSQQNHAIVAQNLYNWR